MNRTLHVAIIGSGPSGFYAAEELLTQKEIKITVNMFDRLPTPFGLVRGGVAPDHQKIKTVAKVYDKTASREGFRFFGNVEFGRDILIEDLKKNYDAVIIAVGAKSDRKMGIPGEDLTGSYPATIFVGWYNGHPDYQSLTFDLSHERVAVIGVGNVAVDVTRILAQDPKSLETTDIAGYALEALRKSNVKEVYLIGRRGVAQAAFTDFEIRELCHLPGCDLVVDPKDVELDELSKEDLNAGKGGIVAKNNVQVLTEQSKLGRGSQPKKIILKFLLSPVELAGENGRVSSVKFEKNVLYRDKDGSIRPKGTGQYEVLPAGLVFRSVGYKGQPLTGVPYDERKGTVPNELGRVIDPLTKKQVDGLYVVGWAKRGPTGVIGTNKPDSIETVKKLLEDFQGRNDSAARNPDAILELLKARGVRFVSYPEWKKLDEIETESGKKKGKSREKFSNIPDMLSAIGR